LYFSVTLLGGIIGIAGFFKGWEIGIYAMYPLSITVYHIQNSIVF
jgi:hypothetical protein